MFFKKFKIQTMIPEWKTIDSLRLTNGRHAVAQNEEPARFWRKIHLNEWTFSLSLLIFSFSIVLGKLYANYGNSLSWQVDDRYHLPTVTTFARMYDTLGFSSMSVLPKLDLTQLPTNSEKLLNASNQYMETAANGLIEFYEKFGWLLRALISGVAITSFTWFIIYMDSSIPGVNPPFPFSSSRQRIREGSRMHLNYFVGVLNGILLFIYMCL